MARTLPKYRSVVRVLRREKATKARLARALRDKRLQYKLTISSVARIVGCSTTTIGELERRNRGSFDLLEAYAWALGYELPELLR